MFRRSNLITAGFQGALGLIIQALLKPGVKVWVEDPGYVFARNLLQQSPTSDSWVSELMMEGSTLLRRPAARLTLRSRSLHPRISSRWA